MNAVKMAAIAFIALGTLALIYGGFSFTKETHDVKLGPLEMSIQEKETVNVPIWAGIAGIVIGGALLLSSKKS